ncbi:MAG: PrsW family intramembrane metalloprotease [Ornithinimicrobium sp.]|jgi:RsiW-degrading membrane proteinase PrsW (M82 family)|uniref:PrsW family intramembrane metalloprotease n=1 Tax=Ornithinimicrobium sp. TaxID=1977084 RepID=UPI003D9B42BC
MTAAALQGTPPNATGRPRVRRLIGWGVAATAFLLGALAIAIVVTESVGVQGTLLGLVVSTTAIAVVLPLFLWVDRLEAEPARMMWFAFLWGALIATSASLVTNTIASLVFAGLGFDPDLATAVIAAPVNEELFKGLGLLVIFLFARREFNGVVDGIAYAGVIAIGFAYVEDILYLGQNFRDLGQEGLIATFIVRCLLTPFAHPMFTVCTGLAFGLIAHRRRWAFGWVPLIGYAVAVAGHAAFNLSLGQGMIALGLLWIPLFIGFLLIVGFARRSEVRMMREHLTGYGLNGWFSPAEVAMLVSPSERRRARGWAKSAHGLAGASAMRSFQDEAAELAIAREHLERGDAGWRPREQRLLASVCSHRQVFAG